MLEGHSTREEQEYIVIILGPELTFITMKLINLNSTFPTKTTHFIHPTFNFHQTKHPTTHHPLLLKAINTPSSLETTLLRQPQYKHNPISISSQQQHYNNQTYTNTILHVLRLMDNLGLVVTPDIYASFIDECTRNRDVVQARLVYTHITQNCRMLNLLKRSSGLCLFNRVLLMLVTCGCFEVAHQLFDKMPHRNFVSLSVVMAGLVDNRLFQQALVLFVKMHQWFVCQESDIGLRVVVVCFLKACLHSKNVDMGKMVHGWLVKMGYDRGLFVDTLLVELYGKCGCLWEANNVFFDSIKIDDHRDTVLWTGAIVNNCRGQCFMEVIRMFRDMSEAGVRMNEYTFSTVLKACGRVGDEGSYGQQVHANAIKLAIDTHVFVLCALVDMYGRCGFLTDAKKVFDMIDHRKRNSACWNAMISGFIQHGLYIEAIKLMYRMKAAGLQPKQEMIDEVRLACGSLKL